MKPVTSYTALLRFAEDMLERNFCDRLHCWLVNASTLSLLGLINGQKNPCRGQAFFFQRLDKKLRFGPATYARFAPRQSMPSFWLDRSTPFFP